MYLNVLKKNIEKERKKVNTTPSEKQIEVGNYKKGHINILGFDITIENPKGSYRSGVDKNGKKWKQKLYYDYGYFKKTLGKDGDAIDVFIGPYLSSKKIFCIDQFIDGNFDETKVMIGFKDKNSAKHSYLKNYEKGWNGFKEITEVDIDTFKKWLYDGKKQRKPFYDYSEIKHIYITESQYKYIKNKLLRESYNTKSWETVALDKWQKNGKVKLYHCTSTNNMESILADEEITCDNQHSEGHGDMLWFTLKPDEMLGQCQISIEVPIERFGHGFDDFYMMNDVHCIFRHPISTDSFNFKIEKVGPLDYDEIIERLKVEDMTIEPFFEDKPFIREYFFKQAFNL